MSDRTNLGEQATISAIAETLAENACARCKDKDAQHGDQCHEMLRADAKAIYMQFVAPLQQNLKFRYIIEWILAGCIVALLLVLPKTGFQHHVLERAVGIFTEAISFSHLRSELRIAEARAAAGTEGPVEVATPKLEHDRCPLGILNNNPLNVKGRDWAGQTGNDPQGHAVFSHPFYGLRAGAKTLKKYQEQGVSTVRGIVDKWATGNKDAYVSFLAKRLNITPDQEIDILAMLPWVVEAMVLFEVGNQPYPPATYALLGLHADM